MKKLIICCHLFLFSLVGFGQNPTISGSYQDTGIEAILLDFESQAFLHFYFIESWLDSLQFTGNFNNTPIDEALNQLLSDTKINAHRIQNHIYLTYNTPIIVDFPLRDTRTQVQNQVTAGMVFQQEYLESDDKKDEVISIGDRSKMVFGGKSTLVGRVTNQSTGEPILNAIVMIKSPFNATVTDENGFYSLTLENKKQEITYQCVGMKPKKKNIVLFSDGTLNVQMDQDIIALDEVVIRSDRDQNVQQMTLGITKIDVEETKSMPMVLGERDLMKVATTTAGVQAVGEGANGYNIRGGKADQNLIMLDGSTIYNSSHFFGFFSAFNTDILEGLDIYKGSIPAQYGGRLSSILAFESQRANNEIVKGKGGISPVTSNVTVEFPLKSEEIGMLVSARTTYSNWILKQVEDVNIKENKISFYDLTTKINWDLGKQGELYASGYFSRDHYRLPTDTLFSFSNFSYANATAALGWNTTLSEKTDLKVSLNHTNYSYLIKFDESQVNAFKQDFRIRETSLNALFSWYKNDDEKIEYGLSSKKYSINPGTKTADGVESAVEPIFLPTEQGIESALFVSYKWNIAPRLSLKSGLRYSMFNLLGPTTINEYDPTTSKNTESILETRTVNKGSVAQTYHYPELRLSGKFLFDENRSIKAGFDMTNQYIHALTNSASLSPTDIWRLSSPHVLPQRSKMISIGYFHNLLGAKLEASIEGYYKFLDNLTDFKVGGDFLLNSSVETEIIQGKGKAYGLEFSITKSGKLNGSFNYSYARTFIKLDGRFADERINGGSFYPTSYDKPHTVNVVANYKITRRFGLSSNLTFNTGRPMTVPVASYDYAGGQSIHYSDRNAYRIPNYFRVDLGLSIEGNHKKVKPAHGFWTISIYNLLGRDNPYSVFFDIASGEVKGYQLVIFGDPIPTLTYHFKF